MTIIKKIFLLALSLGFLSGLDASSGIVKIQKNYEERLRLFELLRSDADCKDYDAMLSFCSCFDGPFSKAVKELRNDTQAVLLLLKKEGADVQCFYNQLKDLSLFLKKNKLVFNAILEHNRIENLYRHLFDMIDSNEDIVSYIDKHRELFGLQNAGDSYLSLFLKDVKNASRQVGRIEDSIHSDSIDLKMQNYVFKIELIKLRNAILFSKQYKL